MPEKCELKYPALGSRSNKPVVSLEAGQGTAHEAASYTPVHSGKFAGVTVYLSCNLDQADSPLEENEDDSLSVRVDYIESYVPAPLMRTASERRGVFRVRQIIPLEPGRKTRPIIGKESKEG